MLDNVLKWWSWLRTKVGLRIIGKNSTNTLIDHGRMMESLDMAERAKLEEAQEQEPELDEPDKVIIKPKLRLVSTDKLINELRRRSRGLVILHRPLIGSVKEQAWGYEMRAKGTFEEVNTLLSTGQYILMGHKMGCGARYTLKGDLTE